MFRDAITGLRFRIILGLVGIKAKIAMLPYYCTTQ